MIIAIDPGLTTGMAFRFDNQNWATKTITPEAGMLGVLSEITKREPSLVVIEAYIGSAALNKYAIETLELIGAVRGVCLIRGVPVEKRIPAVRKLMELEAGAFLTARKKAMRGVFNYTVHEVSALAHLLTWERHVAKRSVVPKPATVNRVSKPGTRNSVSR